MTGRGKMRSLIASCLAATMLGPSTSLSHHSHANLNRDDIQQHTGIVTQYVWRMPHVFLRIEAPDRAGEVVEWTIELLHPAGMLELGWDSDSFREGDVITWEGAMDRDPERYYSGLTWADKADGMRLTGRASDRLAGVVQPSTDFSGLWARDTARTGFFYYPPEDWPYTEFARSRVDSFDERRNPQYDCENPGPPMSTLLPYPLKISWLDESTFEIAYDMRDQTRIVRLGGQPAPGAPSKTGQSRAWMDGEDLVVETDNFVPDRWGSHRGVDSSEEKHLVERFSLIDGGLLLRVQMTLTDPVYVSEPVDIDYYMRKMPDRDVMPENCSLEAARLFIEAGYR